MNKDITNQIVYTGSLAAIGATALRLAAIDATRRPLLRGVTVKAVGANTGKVYVGLSTVTAGIAAPTTDGFELSAGDSVTLEIDDPSKIYVISTSTGQAVTWIAD